MLPLPSVVEQDFHWCGRPWRDQDLPTAFLQQTPLVPPAALPLDAQVPSPDRLPRFVRRARTRSARRPGCRRDVSPRDTCSTRSDWTPPRRSPPPVFLLSPLPSPFDLLRRRPSRERQNLSCLPTCDTNASESACRRPLWSTETLGWISDNKQVSFNLIYGFLKQTTAAAAQAASTSGSSVVVNQAVFKSSCNEDDNQSCTGQHWHLLGDGWVGFFQWKSCSIQEFTTLSTRLENLWS